MSENSEQYFFNFSFFKVDPKWRWMADLAKEESAKEVENICFPTPNVQTHTVALLTPALPSERVNAVQSQILGNPL